MGDLKTGIHCRTSLTIMKTIIDKECKNTQNTHR